MLVNFLVGDASDLNASNVYRALWPAAELNRIPGLKCQVTDRPIKADVHVLQRQLTDGEFPSGMQNVILDLDDDLTNNHRDLGRDGWLESTVSQCAAIMVTTPALGRAMKRYGRPIYVLPTHIDTEGFGSASMAAPRKIEGLTLGVLGGRSHWGDYIQLVEPLREISRNYPVTVIMGGYCPPYMTGVENIKFIPPGPFEKYPAMARQFDIVLLPLDESDKFNHSKSEVAALLAMSACRPLGRKRGGAAVIASKVVYGDVAVHHQYNGWVVEGGGWYNAMAHLIGNRLLRQKLQKRGLRWVREHRDISLAGPMWADAFTQILEGR